MVYGYFPQNSHDDIVVNTNFAPQSGTPIPSPPIGGTMEYQNFIAMEYEDLVDMDYEE